jgi:hypothetical protein
VYSQTSVLLEAMEDFIKQAANLSNPRDKKARYLSANWYPSLVEVYS